ncbi:hypothetical protein H696_02318 [Fonticula alba]|uniref:TM2 domain-containing protein n=1 Tax=Fonticula alba TaxID=691883 RepID=A0A058ZBQ9_FONAL|nr:hypothetical protein H696_02318 [Fonticula alba]KCV71366.1 hypothetical protein H696_02318 [Fonticula alba]|eukprot:XP_009494489.1 hypothetical protein H696_02318 [Fonticula alba]
MPSEAPPAPFGHSLRPWCPPFALLPALAGLLLVLLVNPATPAMAQSATRPHDSMTSASAFAALSIPACDSLHPFQLECEPSPSCAYGVEQATVSCTALPHVACTGPRTVQRESPCLFCHQLPAHLLHCRPANSDDLPASPMVFAQDPQYRHQENPDPGARKPACNSLLRDHHYAWHICEPAIGTQACLGRRSFDSFRPCTWINQGGANQMTTLALSFLLGPTGADRFYLGHIGYGFLKLLTFGGLSLMNLVDAVAVYTGLLQPTDGSLLFN